MESYSCGLIDLLYKLLLGYILAGILTLCLLWHDSEWCESYTEGEIFHTNSNESIDSLIATGLLWPFTLPMALGSRSEHQNHLCY